MDLSKLFLGEDPRVVDEFTNQLGRLVGPFIKLWWDGVSPIATGDEVEAQRARFRALIHGTSEEYSDAAICLDRLFNGWRFNRRNFVNIHPLPMLPPLIASLVVSMQNPNNIVPEVSEATTELERECIEFLAELVGYDVAQGPWGNVVSCGTVANMTALLVARDYTYDKLDRPRDSLVGPAGLSNKQRGVVIASASAHYSLKKAMWFLGLGSDNLIEVPVAVDEAVRLKHSRDERFLKGIYDGSGIEYGGLIRDAMRREMKLDELERFYAGEDEPFCLQPLDSEILKALYTCFEYDTPLLAAAYTLGTTETGTIERMLGTQTDSPAFGILKEQDVPIHADAAIGGYAMTIPAIASAMVGIAECDSVTIDGHKLGFLPYPCGVVLFAHRGARHQIYHEAPYLEGLAPTLEGSRPGSNVAACWVAQKMLGKEGYAQAIQPLVEFASVLADEIRTSREFQLLHTVDLNTVCFAIRRPGIPREQLNRMAIEVANEVTRRGRFIVNKTTDLAKIKVKNLPGMDTKLVDIASIRVVAANPLVDPNDASRLVEELEAVLAEVESRSPQG